MWKREESVVRDMAGRLRRGFELMNGRVEGVRRVRHRNGKEIRKGDR